MKAEEAKKIADQALQNLTDALKSGKSERITQYLAMLAKFHRYSFGNVLLINGDPHFVLHVKRNEVIRFYAVNASNAR